MMPEIGCITRLNLSEFPSVGPGNEILRAGQALLNGLLPSWRPVVGQACADLAWGAWGVLAFMFCLQGFLESTKQDSSRPRRWEGEVQALPGSPLWAVTPSLPF